VALLRIYYAERMYVAPGMFATQSITVSCTPNVGSACLIGRQSSKQPPGSIAMSTSTATRLHMRSSRIRDQVRCPGASHQHSPDHKIGLLDRVGELQARRVSGVITTKLGVELTQLGHVERRLCCNATRIS
jgi:hypothetical protein